MLNLMPLTSRRWLLILGPINIALTFLVGWEVSVLRHAREPLALTVPLPAARRHFPDAGHCPAARDMIRRDPDGTVLIDRLVLSILLRVPDITAEGRLVPFIADRVPSGLGVFGVRAGGALDCLGLRNGDVIRRVDGRPVSGYPTLRAADDAIGDDGMVALDVDRAGGSVTLRAHILRSSLAPRLPGGRCDVRGIERAHERPLPSLPR